MAVSLDVKILWMKGKIKYSLLEEIKRSGVRVPVGFTSDGPSIPQPLWWILPKSERYLLDSMVHDYSLQVLRLGWRRSNNIMKDSMVESGVPKWMRAFVGLGIEIGMLWDHVKWVVGRDQYVRNSK